MGEPGSGPEQGGGAMDEMALFVVWSRGRHAQRRILADLRRRFEVRRICEVVWSPSRVTQNFRRFYPDLEVRGAYHALGKGRRPFLAAIVLDREPRITECETSRGRRVVNARFLDAKTEYRRWAGRLTIHCTETPFETRRDLTMLFGLDANPDGLSTGVSSAHIQTVHRDLVGARTWSSESELFEVLNRSVNYVVTGAAGASAKDSVLHSPEVNLLTDDYLTLHAVLNARPSLASPNGGPARVRIAGRWVDVRLRFVGDRFFDTAWAEQLLASRRLDEAGRFRPPDKDDFKALVYDLYSHRRHRTPCQLQRLTTLAAALDFDEWPSDPSAPATLVKPLLDRWLRENRYAWVEPIDPSVPYRPSIPGSPETTAGGVVYTTKRRISWWGHRMMQGAKGWYWLARDQAVTTTAWFRASRWSGPGGTWMTARRALGHPRLFMLKRLVLLGRGLLYAGRTYRCPCCGWSLRAFVGPWGALATNHDGYCPRCNSKARHRRLWLYLLQETNLLKDPLRALEVAPWWAISRRLMKASNVRYVGLDICRNGPHVTVVGDVTRIPLATDSLEAALCVHTLEHVEEDRLAMRELHRVLKPGGWALISVPLRLDGPTHEDPMVTDPGDRAREFGERSHVRLYGLDIEDRLREAGFEVDLDEAAGIPTETRKRFGLRDDENLFMCRKSAPSD